MDCSTYVPLRQAAEQLWQLVGVGAELPAHLATLRAYFLLGRGDLFQTFLLEACSSIPYPSLATHMHLTIV